MADLTATSPLLTYSIAPTSVAIGSTQSFTVTATNASAVNVMVNPGDSIIIGNLQQLATGNVTPQQPATPWRMAQNWPSLRIWVTQQVVLAPTHSAQFVFNGVQIVQQTGSASLSVLETIAGASNYAPPLVVAIVNALTVSAQAIPSTVGLGQKVKLTWTSVGASYVTIQPGSSQQYPTTGYIMVLPAQNAPQTTYTVTATASGGGTANQPVPVNMASPVLNSFTVTPSQNLAIDEKINMSWATTYASQVQIQPAPAGSPYVQLSGSLEIKPSRALAVNASETTYSLTASGYGSPALGSVNVTFAPLVINWFRYTDFTLSKFTVGVTNTQGYQISGSATPAVLTANGPGGPLTAQLGGTGPEVQVLIAVPASVASGASTQLQYLVRNVTGLTLNPGGQALSFDATGKGTVTVTPLQTTTYTLSATNGTTTVTSQLQVIVTS